MATCFVIQPFDRGKFDRRYKDTFEPAITKAGFEAYRVDEDPSVSIPIEQIEKGIREAAVSFAEISTDNANVWFELGYAIACSKPIVMVCESNARTKFPFDVQHRTVIIYDTEAPSDFTTLEAKIIKRLKAINKTEAALEKLAKELMEVASRSPGTAIKSAWSYVQDSLLALGRKFRLREQGTWNGGPVIPIDEFDRIEALSPELSASIKNLETSRIRVDQDSDFKPSIEDAEEYVLRACRAVQQLNQINP